ncbi:MULTISPECIES: gp16 family protein [Pasteurellaceae]|uniref:Regulatory protein GemA n=1 Tax=Pasteurella atlantica TaxID=2827233 RepID=A0AAW8CI21_9PAST|nr:regulatory protein GemA [Pasteurella atlantica]MBR0573702.1 regulatory protein GemA [Pasteurella atlantica]MDP8039663.1 regulatory protein GemA [Pasteurella atlantica]MDP8041754.1 regulatory protein GemA [Pasteurella atlantica]MDP8043972.1 regulatory protein GemA [Pasteurella atlantica]MDP8045950.1 regulatory protein GemA [Pasteurella atlantica]
MTSEQLKNEKKRLIMLVKIGQKQLNMADDSYRAMLMRLTNKNSATKCSIVDLHKVISELKTKGAKLNEFANFNKKKTASYRYKSAITPKIYVIWQQMARAGFIKDGSKKALDTWARKIINPRPNGTLMLNINGLRDHEATIVLECLKKWQQRMQEAK